MTADGAFDVLGRVDRLGQGDALAPAFGVGPDDPHQQDVPIGLGPERRLERGDQFQPDPAKLHRLDLHSSCFLVLGPGENIPTVTADETGHESSLHGGTHRVPQSITPGPGLARVRGSAWPRCRPAPGTGPGSK